MTSVSYLGARLGFVLWWEMQTPQVCPVGLTYLSDQGVLPFPYCFRLDERWVRPLTQEVTHPVPSKLSSSYGRWWHSWLRQCPWFPKAGFRTPTEILAMLSRQKLRLPELSDCPIRGRHEEFVLSVYPQLSWSPEWCVLGVGECSDFWGILQRAAPHFAVAHHWDAPPLKASALSSCAFHVQVAV